MASDWNLTFRPIRFAWTLALFVFICLNSPWYVSLAAALMILDIEVKRPSGKVKVK